MPRTLEIAIQTALAKRGVAVVVLPGDIALLNAENDDRRVNFTMLNRTFVPAQKSWISWHPSSVAQRESRFWLAQVVQALMMS